MNESGKSGNSPTTNKMTLKQLVSMKDNVPNLFGSKAVNTEVMTKPGPSRTVSDDEIIAAIKDVDAPFASTKDVSERIGLGTQASYDRLRQLEDMGVIRSKKAGNGRGWWVI